MLYDITIFSYQYEYLFENSSSTLGRILLKKNIYRDILLVNYTVQTSLHCVRSCLALILWAEAELSVSCYKY